MKMHIMLLSVSMTLIAGGVNAMSGLENIQAFGTGVNANEDIFAVTIANEDALVLVGVCVDNGESPVTNLTLGGVSPDGFFQNDRANLAYFINPPTGSNDLVVTRPSAVTSSRAVVVGEILGVDLSNPLNSSTNINQITTVDNTGAGASGIYIVDYCYQNNSDGGTATQISGAIQSVDHFNDLAVSQRSVLGSAYVKKDAATYQLGWDWSSGFGTLELALAFNVTSSIPAMVSMGGIPEGLVSDSTPLIEAYFRDVGETLDSVTMTIDGDVVIPDEIIHTNSFSTVRYTPPSALTLDVDHTVRIVAASVPSGMLVTNEFSFYLGFPISYVDVTTNNTLMADNVNGPVGEGVPFMTVPDNGGSLWRGRYDNFGINPSVTNEPAREDYGPYTAGNSVFESDNGANCPRLKTSAFVPAEGSYRVFVYGWFNSEWDIRAGLEDTAGIDSLPLYNSTSTNAVALFNVGPDFWGTHTLYRVYLGTVNIANTNTPITVYMEDAIGAGGRSWVDGIGFQPLSVSVPTIAPDILSSSISSGMVHLMWTSEPVGTYRVMRKTALNESSWTAVTNGITGGDPTTSASVPVSGALSEFYRIEGD